MCICICTFYTIRHLKEQPQAIFSWFPFHRQRCPDIDAAVVSVVAQIDNLID